MKRLGLTIAVAVLFLTTLACRTIDIEPGRTVRGSGDIGEETREVGRITGVELATIGTLHIDLGSDESLRIEAEDNILDYIQTDVRNERLVIRMRDNVNLRTTRPINYYLTVKALDSIEISSSGDVIAPSLEANRFSVSINSSGNLSMRDLDADELTVKINSSGDMQMETLRAETLDVTLNSSGNLSIDDGKVERQEITINSSGDYRARGVESDEAEVHLNSSGNATIRVSDVLRARLESSGSVSYIGDPAVDATIKSSGDVVQIEE